MAYARAVVEAVEERYRRKRKRAEEDAASREMQAGLVCPEIAAITRTLDATGLRVLKAASQGTKGLEERIAELQRENETLTARRAALLEENGFPADYLSLRCECEVCGDTGSVNGAMCACMKKELAREAYRTAGLGAVLREQRFDTFDLSYYSDVKGADGYSPRDRMKFVYEQTKAYAENFRADAPPVNLLFIGTTGLGKTHLSTAVAAELITRGVDVVYDTVQNILSAFEKKTFRYDAEAADLVDRYLTSELLIIDDLGTEFKSSFSQSVLYELLNTRVNAGLAMIVSTNLADLSEFKKQYDDRIVSRLVGSFRSFKFTGEDVRIQKLKQNKQ